jgi:transcription antitermination factor NusG
MDEKKKLKVQVKIFDVLMPVELKPHAEKSLNVLI